MTAAARQQNRRPGGRAPAVVAAIAGCVLIAWYLVSFEGNPRPTDPLVVVRLTNSETWLAQPTLLEHLNEPGAIYVAYGLPAAGGMFEGIRVDTRSGGQSSARLAFGPGTSYMPFDSAEVVGNPVIGFRGLALRRPAFHLLSFPGGGGPGIHYVDSATGAARVVFVSPRETRTLLTWTIVNSRRLPELASHAWLDRRRRLAAILWRDIGWTLYLFSLSSD